MELILCLAYNIKHLRIVKGNVEDVKSQKGSRVKLRGLAVVLISFS